MHTQEPQGSCKRTRQSKICRFAFTVKRKALKVNNKNRKVLASEQGNRRYAGSHLKLKGKHLK